MAMRIGSTAAVGVLSVAVVAPAIGPVLAGVIVDNASWRWIFLINLPIGVVGVPVAWRLLRDTGYRERRPLDRSGLALCGGGLAVFLVGLEQAASHGWLEALPLGFLVLNAGVNREPGEIVREEVQHVREKIGPVAAFKNAVVVNRLPKTRSGKILRGTMKKIADRTEWKMPATIDDPVILDEITERLQAIGYA